MTSDAGIVTPNAFLKPNRLLEIFLFVGIFFLLTGCLTVTTTADLTLNGEYPIKVNNDKKFAVVPQAGVQIPVEFPEGIEILGANVHYVQSGEYNQNDCPTPNECPAIANFGSFPLDSAATAIPVTWTPALNGTEIVATVVAVTSEYEVIASEFFHVRFGAPEMLLDAVHPAFMAGDCVELLVGAQLFGAAQISLSSEHGGFYTSSNCAAGTQTSSIEINIAGPEQQTVYFKTNQTDHSLEITAISHSSVVGDYAIQTLRGIWVRPSREIALYFEGYDIGSGNGYPEVQMDQLVTMTVLARDKFGNEIGSGKDALYENEGESSIFGFYDVYETFHPGAPGQVEPYVEFSGIVSHQILYDKPLEFPYELTFRVVDKHYSSDQVDIGYRLNLSGWGATHVDGSLTVIALD